MRVGLLLLVLLSACLGNTSERPVAAGQEMIVGAENTTSTDEPDPGNGTQAPIDADKPVPGNIAEVPGGTASGNATEAPVIDSGKPISDNTTEKTVGGTMEKLAVSSSFGNGEPIPKEYTCDGSDISPPLTIGGLSRDARSIAIILDDPDAPGGTFVHWVIWNIPPLKDIPKNIPQGRTISSPFSANQGTTSFGDNGYGGPCPPAGKPHRYYFRVYALDSMLGLDSGTREDLEDAMKGHVLQQGELMGTYSR